MITPYIKIPVLINIFNYVAKLSINETIILTDDKKIPDNCIVVIHPHGYAPFNVIYHFIHPALSHIKIAWHSMSSFMPVLGWFGLFKRNMMTVDKNDILNILKKKKVSLYFQVV